MFFKDLRPSFILSPAKPPIPKFFRSSGNLFYLKTSFSSSCFLCKSEDIIRIRKNRKLMRTRRKVFLRKAVAMKEDTFRLTGERTRPLTSMIFFQGCQPNGRSRALLRNKRTNSLPRRPNFPASPCKNACKLLSGLQAFDLASPARFERAAFRLGGERSILLSYGDIDRKHIYYKHLGRFCQTESPQVRRSALFFFGNYQSLSGV